MKIVLKNKFFIIAIALVAGITAFILTYLKPPVYDASVDFTTHYVSRGESINNKDEYSTMKAAGILGENIESWFSSPSFVKSIYEKAEVNCPASINHISGKFRAKQKASQNIVIRFQDANKENAEKLVSSMKNIVNEKVSNLNQFSRYDFFTVSSNEPVISEVYPNANLAGLIGLICGLILGVFIVYFKSSIACPVLRD